MRIVKVFIVALAALFAVSTVQAATFVKPVGTPGIESSVELTKGKKKAKKAKKSKKAKKRPTRKKARASAAPTCTTRAANAWTRGPRSNTRNSIVEISGVARLCGPVSFAIVGDRARYNYGSRRFRPCRACS
jgi:hypothetical protein